ncbi:MDR family MFS transporter [Dellaglioa carnosa]|uniref:MFS transporter n=1 Tax=Dellaglioa carnosa TaxID=2995136 RepID=A0ABT4JM22_9LACO|nr:MDR family MFS transporter [Dellaglioa carnosa]MCZ2491411.1 MFS transporter [Dellaglioa carnosa]MCZ2494489.1 MFS transporter [Dellaglioa carnosa]MDK1731095.1 MFS transporter [Dellaglioa carnosa]
MEKINNTVSFRKMVPLLIPLMLVLFISTLDQTIVATALPTIGKDLGDTQYISWVATAFLLTSAITTLLFGKIGDMYGRKGIFQFSIIVFLIGSILSGASQNMVMLILFRAIQGIGAGGLNSLVMAIIGDIVPPLQRSKYMAYTGAISMLALVAGPFLGGALVEHVSWQWIFYINVPIGLLALIMAAWKLDLPKPTAHGQVDITGGILAAVVTATLLLVITWGGEKYTWNSTQIISLIIVTGLGMLAYIFTEIHAASPITPLHMFKSGTFVISAIQFMFATLALFVGMLFIPMFLQYMLHYSATKAGLMIIPMMIGLIMTTAVSGAAISKTGKYKIYPIIGAAITGAAMFGLSTISIHTSMWFIGTMMVVAGGGIGFMIQVALLAGQNAVSYKFLGTATGTLNFFKSIGGAFGTALFGVIYSNASKGVTTTMGSVHAFDAVFMWVIPFMIISVILGLVMTEKPLSAEMEKIASGEEEAPEW